MPRTKSPVSNDQQSHNHNRDFKGIWVPKEIYLNEDLSWTEKILLIEIHSLDGQDGCFASNEYFARFLNKSEVTISNSISKLKKLGFIKQESFNGRRRVLKSLIEPDLKKTLSLPQRKPKVRSINNTNNSFFINKKTFITNSSNSKKNSFITFWNNLPNVRKHKSTKTKTYCKASKFLTDLQNGNFQKRVRIDRQWLRKHKLPRDLASKKFTCKEIKRALTNLSLLFKEGYWPENKKTIPQDLPTLIYNPKTQVSFFLMFYKKKPELLQVKDPFPEITEKCIYEIDQKLDHDERKKLIQNLKSLRTAYNKVVNKGTSIQKRFFEEHYWSFKAFVKAYLEYLELKTTGQLNIYAFHPTSSQFQQFKSGGYDY